MVTSSSYFSYKDVFELLDRAIEDGQGLRIPFSRPGDAFQFRVRLHTARRLDRERNKEIFEDPEHPMHGCSIYDGLVASIRHEKEKTYLYLKVNSIANLEVEPLSEAGE